MLQAYGHHRPELRLHQPLLDAAASVGNPVDGSNGEKRRSSPVGLTAMRWSLQAGAALIPRSRRAEYVAANLGVFEVPPLPPEALHALRVTAPNTSLYGLHEAFVQDWIA